MNHPSHAIGPPPRLDSGNALRPWRLLPHWCWWLCAFLMACGWDRALWLQTSDNGHAHLAWLESWASLKTLGHALRTLNSSSPTPKGELLAGVAYGFVYSLGRLWIWIALGVVIIARSWVHPDPRRVTLAMRQALCVITSAAIAGGLAELLKLIARRMRPEVADGFYTFKPVTSGIFDAGGIGLASSHAAVAMGAAIAAGWAMPKARWLFWLLAIVCAASRIAVGAHFLSDVVAGLALGVVGASLGYALDERLFAHPAPPKLSTPSP